MCWGRSLEQRCHFGSSEKPAARVRNARNVSGWGVGGLGDACNEWRGSMRKKERLQCAKEAGEEISREPWSGCQVFQIKACRGGGS